MWNSGFNACVILTKRCYKQLVSCRIDPVNWSSINTCNTSLSTHFRKAIKSASNAMQGKIEKQNSDAELFLFLWLTPSIVMLLCEQTLCTQHPSCLHKDVIVQNISSDWALVIVWDALNDSHEWQYIASDVWGSWSIENSVFIRTNPCP